MLTNKTFSFCICFFQQENEEKEREIVENSEEINQDVADPDANDSESIEQAFSQTSKMRKFLLITNLYWIYFCTLV